MTAKEILLRELEQAPAELVDEVLEFLRRLRSKVLADNETALLSEKALADGWIGKDEDQAWNHQSLVN